MNRAGASKLLPTASITQWAIEGDVDRVFDQWMLDQWTDHLVTSSPSRLSVVGHGNGAGQVVFNGHGDERTMGYVTKDACPGSGDDIDHVPGKPLPPLILSVRPHRSFLLPALLSVHRLTYQYRIMAINRKLNLVAYDGVKADLGM